MKNPLFRSSPDTQPPPARLPRGGACVWWEVVGGLGALSLLALVLIISWRKWPDPLVDFGRELYTPWRIAEGAVLYRDVDDMYGPLSHFFNAALFGLFGPGIMVLVTANLLIYGGILGLLYMLFRRAWGPPAALVSCAVFIGVFSFSQLLGVGNFNYATPYAHSVTHGMLVCLALAAVLLRWLDKESFAFVWMAGALFGLTLVLKPEFILCALAMTAVAIMWRIARNRTGLASLAWRWFLAACLPTVLFALYFARYLPWPAATAAAGHAWLVVINGRGYVGDPSQLLALGLDAPLPNLAHHMEATAVAAVLCGLIAAAVWLGRSKCGRGIAFAGGGLIAAILAWVSWSHLSWIHAGQCLLGLVLAYAIGKTVWLRWERTSPAEAGRLVLTVLAIALMARMPLAGRIYQYGFYQAALAGMMIPAVLLGEMPSWFGAGRRGHILALVTTLALVGPQVVQVVRESDRLYSTMTVQVGTGRDRFYAFPPSVRGTGAIVRTLIADLQTSPDRTLLVLPDGVMLNYLLRRPNPLAPFYYYSAALAGTREAELVKQLERTPPDCIVVISHRLEEFGIKRYGDAPGSGQLIIEWIAANYPTVKRIGDNPFLPEGSGALVLRRGAVPPLLPPP